MVTRQLRWVFAPLLLLVAAPPVEAQDKTGWGVSATVGGSQIRDKDGPDTFSGNAVGFTAEFEYRFTPYFALGFGGFSLGRTNDDFGGVDTEIAVRGYSLFGRVIYPASDTFDLYGRIGAANYFVDIDPGSVSIDDALFGQDAVELGIGVDFARTKKAAFRIEGRFLNGGRDETGVLFTVGVNYLF
jgi:hypothetical protein